MTPVAATKVTDYPPIPVFCIRRGAGRLVSGLAIYRKRKGFNSGANPWLTAFS